MHVNAGAAKVVFWETLNYLMQAVTYDQNLLSNLVLLWFVFNYCLSLHVHLAFLSSNTSCPAPLYVCAL